MSLVEEVLITMTRRIFHQTITTMESAIRQDHAVVAQPTTTILRKLPQVAIALAAEVYPPVQPCQRRPIRRR